MSMCHQAGLSNHTIDQVFFKTMTPLLLSLSTTPLN